MTWRLVAGMAALALVTGLAPAAGAVPKTVAKMDVAGTYDSHGDVAVRVWPKQGKVGVRTLGFAGEGTVTCANQACVDRGLDGTTVAATRDLEIVLNFKGTDEELQAVQGRSRGSFIFADGFESGDLSSWVRGTATCAATEGGRVCDVDVRLRGRLKGPDLTGVVRLALRGELTLSGGTATWALVDWLGSLEVQD